MRSRHHHPTQTETAPIKTYKIDTIPGDGIGKEVVPAGQEVLAALAASSKTFQFNFENFDWLANPIGTFWSVVMLLEHLGENAAARQVMAAIEAVTANPSLHTGDLGGKATTVQVTKAVCDFLGGQQQEGQARAA